MGKYRLTCIRVDKGFRHQDAISVNSDSTGYSSAEEEETMPGGQVRVRVWVSTEQELGNDIGAMWVL